MRTASRIFRAGVELLRLNRQQWWDPERLRDLQFHRLRSAIRHAEQRSPFYRDRFRTVGFRSDDLRTWEDFSRLPVTTRRSLQEPDRMVADGFDAAAMERSHTSGSTGQPTTTYFDPWAWSLGKHILKLRARLACGLRPWDRVAIFQEEESAGARPELLGRLASFSVHRRPSQILDELRAFSPTALYGPPSHIGRLIDAGAEMPELHMIFTSAEMLDGLTRRQLEDAFGVPVMDVYGCTETKEIAWQCPEQGGYHVNAEWLVVEVGDGDGDGAPEGPILVTSLYNKGMPLIRYRLGDTGRTLSGVCECGRGLPMILPVLGRTVDYVQVPDGHSVSPYTLTCAIEDISGIRQYQIVHKSESLVRVRVVPEETFGDREERAIQRRLAPILPGITVEVQRVRHIPREPSGKFRIVRSDVLGPGG